MPAKANLLETQNPTLWSAAPPRPLSVPRGRHGFYWNGKAAAVRPKRSMSALDVPLPLSSHRQSLPRFWACKPMIDILARPANPAVALGLPLSGKCRWLLIDTRLESVHVLSSIAKRMPGFRAPPRGSPKLHTPSALARRAHCSCRCSHRGEARRGPSKAASAPCRRRLSPSYYRDVLLARGMCTPGRR
jgi:hypothetical protein